MKSLATKAKQKTKAKEKAKPKGKAKPAKKTTRTAKHPWEEIETFFVHGEDAAGVNGAPIRTQPSISETARKFTVPITSISQRANTKDVSGKTWYDKRNEYLTAFKTQRDTRIVEEIVDAEVAFRKSTLATAQMIVQHAAVQLHRGLRKDTEGNTRSALDADTLSKLAAASRKGQEIGLVSMERDPNAAKGGDGLDDWTLMRKVRAGQVAVPVSHE